MQLQSVLYLLWYPIASMTALFELPEDEFNIVMMKNLGWLQW